ncbi:hypothetical protein CTAYLR_005048 [Chrysophaeum taylorii]|uniref:Dynein regulatory complex protein 10 n=1 Tax=Chrysophaeum taylorii TaxID=2483200 RepID=A0AAD7UBY1_9STRA|nr:hypothetical protein CTAYLR_005048 [Chrysophaeum taylorii]
MEAQRVIAVLEDTVNRLSDLTLVPTKADPELLEEIATLGDSSLTSAMKEQWELEERYEMAKKSAALDMGQSPEEVKEQLMKSTRALCRQLSKNEAAMEILKRRGTKPSEQLANFQACLSELTAITFRKLSTTVEEEQANKRMLHELTEKERRASEEAAALQQTLEQQRAERDREVSAQEQMLAKLRAELDEVTRTNDAKMASFREQTEAQFAQAEADHKAKMCKLDESIADLETKLEEDSQAHRDAEAALRKKKERAEAELNAQIEKYNRDIDDIKRQTEEIEAKMAAEEEELRVLEEHFAKVDANEKRKNDEEALLDAFRARVKQAEQVLDDAATNVQKIVRGRQLRAFIKQLMSKKGKKGSKKGGKKKK